MGCPVRLMDAADRVVEVPDAYPPRLRPRLIAYQGVPFHAAWVAPDGVWVYRSAERLSDDPLPTVTLITADEREHAVHPDDLPEDAVLWTVRDQQGRVVYRMGDV